MMQASGAHAGGRAGVQATQASKALVDLASESWRFNESVALALDAMDPPERDRFKSRYAWYGRVVQAVLDEAGLSVVDLTGERYDVGMAVTPLNAEDFPAAGSGVLTIAQMVEPIVMQSGTVLKLGTVMLADGTEAR